MLNGIVDGAQLMITRSFKTGETTDCAPSLSSVLQIVIMAIQLYLIRKFCFNWEVEFHDVIADDNSFDGLKNILIGIKPPAHQVKCSTSRRA